MPPLRFSMPNFPCELELPDEWLTEAGLNGFMPTTLAYHSTSDAVLVPLREIEPPFRTPECSKDWRGFDRRRLLAALKGIVAKTEIEPVPLVKLSPRSQLVPAPYGYRVRDGFHRFYASVIAGFECLPATVKNRLLKKSVTADGEVGD
jgi:hypothetical protein